MFLPSFFPLNLPATVFDLLLVEGSFSGGLSAIRCAAPLAVPLH